MLAATQLVRMGKSLAWLLVLCGCADLLGLDDYGDQSPIGDVSTASTSASTAASGGSHTGGHPLGGEGGSACDLHPFAFSAKADTVINDGECDASNYSGGYGYMNVGIGRGLYRFDIHGALVDAFAEGRVDSMSIELSRDVACLGPSEACPAAAGTLVARPLRSDWTEGPEIFTPYMGADWCRRGAGQGSASWQAPGASGTQDSGDVSGTALVDASQPSVTIDLDPPAHQTFVASGDVELSVMVIAEYGAVFVAATKEQPEPSEPPAKLRGAYCLR
jgi:hypothetical protein